MAQRLRVLAAQKEDVNSGPQHPSWVALNDLGLQLHGTQCPLPDLYGHEHTKVGS